MGLNSIPKSAAVDFSGAGADGPVALEIQRQVMPREKAYKYLGIQFCEDSDYLREQEAAWRERATKALRLLHAKSLWKFNRFETTKLQWKATCVPGLTYCNSTLAMGRITRPTIEKAQREAGKWALGQPAFNIANEFIEGELGWSSFEAREAKSKLLYFARVRGLEECPRKYLV